MGVPAETVQTVAMVGVRESLLDEISIITPTEAKFYNALKASGKPKAVKHEFMTDTIRAGASNAVVEGNDPTINASTQPTRIYNNCQIQEESYAVSSTSNAVTAAGRTSEKDQQKLKHMKALTRDMEYAFLREIRVDPGASTAAKMRGALNWCTSNVDKAADASVAATGAITGGTARDLTTGMLKSVLQNIYTAGGGRKTLTAYMNVFQQSMFDTIINNTNNRQMVENGKVNDYVSVYQTAFGTLKADVHIEMPTDVVFIADLSFWKKATLEAVGEKQLATSSALNQKWHITVSHTLESTNEAASGRIVNLTTS